MSDVWVLVAVAVVYILVYAVGEVGRKAASRIGWWSLGFILISPLMTVAHGWMVMVLWNLAVPDVTGLPTLSLVPAIAIAWLSGILFRGVAPRATYDVDADR